MSAEESLRYQLHSESIKCLTSIPDQMQHEIISLGHFFTLKQNFFMLKGLKRSWDSVL